MLPFTTTQTIHPGCHTRWCSIQWSIMTHNILWSRRNWNYIVQCLFFSLLVEDYFRWGKILVQFSDRMYTFSLQSKYMLLMYLFLYESVSCRLKKKTLQEILINFSTSGNPQGKQKHFVTPDSYRKQYLWYIRQKIYFHFGCVTDCYDNQINVLPFNGLKWTRGHFILSCWIQNIYENQVLLVHVNLMNSLTELCDWVEWKRLYFS